MALSLCSLVNILAVNPVLAQDITCQCNLPIGSTGTVSQVKGDVLVSQQAGFQSATRISQFSEGSRIIVGQASEATLNLPGCAVNLNKASTVSLMNVNNQLCLRVEETYAGAGVASASPSWVPAAIFGGIIAGGAIIAIADDGKPVSR